ncbi:hypothetical protein [Synechococcus elongatus]|uniref:hypothetical protein n=1 Tax=Synechococcus elongatus TaxID=32046 RepID=UPI0012601018|nr:hypothetical protein [Synechococcus elongatus]
MKQFIANTPVLRSSCRRLANQLRTSSAVGEDLSLNQDACSSLVFQYYKQARLTLILMDKLAKEKYPNQLIEKGKQLCSLAVALASNDLDRAVYPIAATAWLTTDNFRWHKLQGFQSVPEDLSYGLILDYFEPVVESTRYFLSPTGKHRYRLTREDLRIARAFAVNVIQKHYARNTDETAIQWQLMGDSWG